MKSWEIKNLGRSKEPTFVISYVLFSGQKKRWIRNTAVTQAIVGFKSTSSKNNLNLVVRGCHITVWTIKISSNHTRAEGFSDDRYECIDFQNRVRQTIRKPTL